MADDVTPKRPRFLTIEQVAEELAVGSPTVRQLLKLGELRGLQIGGRGMWRVAAQDLEDYIEQAYRVTAQRIASDEMPDEGSLMETSEG
ncbi:excisionase family DNA binding protein [Arthrobacter pascens]|uniref:helix-turn-helix domain-containing protein n=1 Tax=Arthrobacter pascens TaxID=1677 RepID=UPI002784DF80|nr:helix-turn-helix domain-containing protein [Arthrobacter pascens]MDQ0635068.1 excisionase family DNA binding protein [Arthrobacter pascens]